MPKGKKYLYRLWYGKLSQIIAEYKKDNNISDPLDGDETQALGEVLLAQLDYLEGNITRNELNKKIS